ncbi:MAG: hypothetical protein HY343_11505, partial [Lentisphaerae bacterium]|nr:hypothetical protein [Lentisphaerota bacterium]
VGDGEFTVYDEVQVAVAQLAIEPFDGLLLGGTRAAQVTALLPEGLEVRLRLETAAGAGRADFYDFGGAQELSIAGSAAINIYGGLESSEPDNIRLQVLSTNAEVLVEERFTVVKAEAMLGFSWVGKGATGDLAVAVTPLGFASTNFFLNLGRINGSFGAAQFESGTNTRPATAGFEGVKIIGVEASDEVGNLALSVSLNGVSMVLTNFTVAGLTVEPVGLLRKGQEVYVQVFSQPSGLDLGPIELSIATVRGTGSACFAVFAPMDPIAREETNTTVLSGDRVLVRGKEASSEYENMRLLAGLPGLVTPEYPDVGGGVLASNVFTVVDVAISPLDFIWWGHTTNVAVDIMPPDLVQGTNTLSLSLSTVSGSGEVAFNDSDEGEREIFGSTNVILRSDMYSDEPDNLRLSVNLNGQECASTNFEAILLELAEKFRAISDSWPRNVYVMLSPDGVAGDIRCVLTNSLGGTGLAKFGDPAGGGAGNSTAILLSEARALWGSQLPIAAEALSSEAGDMQLAFEVYGRPLLITNFTVMHVESSPVNFLVKGSSSNLTLTVTPSPCGDNIQLRLLANVDGGGYNTNAEILAFGDGLPTQTITGSTNLTIFAGMPAGTVWGFLNADLDGYYPVVPGLGFPVLGADISLPVRIAPGTSTNITVTILPADAGTNMFSLEVTRTAGSKGMAIFEASGTNVLDVSAGTNVVALVALEAGNAATNLRFSVKCNGEEFFGKNFEVWGVSLINGFEQLKAGVVLGYTSSFEVVMEPVA